MSARVDKVAVRIAFPQVGASGALAVGAWTLAVIFYVATSIVSPGFFTVGHTQDLFSQGAVLGMLALAQTFVLLVGGIDLSVPWTMTMAAVVANTLALSHGFIPALLVGLGLSASVGLANGLGVSLLGLSPIVMTLAMNGIEQGAVSWWAGGSGFVNAAGPLARFANGTTLHVPNIVCVWMALSLMAIGSLRRTVFGRSVYATGSSRRVAWLSGIRSGVVVTGCYVICALVAGLTGILLSGTLTQTYLGMGDTYLFPSIAAAVLGGIAITGGEGGYLGPLGGAIAITALDFLLAALNVSGQVQQVAFGAVLLGAVAVPRLIEMAHESNPQLFARPSRNSSGVEASLHEP